MLRLFALAFLASAGITSVQAADHSGNWQGNAALSFSRSTGNTNGTTYSLDVDEARTTDSDKVSVYVSALYGKSQGTVSADKTRIGSRYDQNLGDRSFWFGLAEFEQDRMANLDLRSGMGAGVGYHLIKDAGTTLDVLGGLSYSRSELMTGQTVSGNELILGEESTHALTENVRFKQKLSYYPSTRNSGDFRTVFDSGLVIGLSGTMGLSISLQNKYNSDVGAGVKHSDTVLLTGLNIKL